MKKINLYEKNWDILEDVLYEYLDWRFDVTILFQWKNSHFKRLRLRMSIYWIFGWVWIHFMCCTERKNLIDSKRSWPTRYFFAANEIIYLTQWYLLFEWPRCLWNWVTLDQLKFYLEQLKVFAWWNVWIIQVKITQWHKKSLYKTRSKTFSITRKQKENQDMIKRQMTKITNVKIIY